MGKSFEERIKTLDKRIHNLEKTTEKNKVIEQKANALESQRTNQTLEQIKGLNEMVLISWKERKKQ